MPKFCNRNLDTVWVKDKSGKDIGVRPQILGGGFVEGEHYRQFPVLTLVEENKPQVPDSAAKSAPPPVDTTQPTADTAPPSVDTTQPTADITSPPAAEGSVQSEERGGESKPVVKAPHGRKMR